MLDQKEKSAASKLEEKHRKELEKKDNQLQAAIDKGVKKESRIRR